MIRIFVKGKELVLNRNTTMTVELNNALFANADVEGDISYSFTFPVEGNELVMGFAHLPQVGKVNTLPCTVYCNCGLNWNGQLLVQKGSRDTITAALLINPYPDGFGKRKLTANNDNEIVISNSKETHDLSWKKFLAASVNNTDIKFAPFFNENGYGSENDSWGYWHGQSRRKVVNELFFDIDGNLIDHDNSPFSKAHNDIFDLSDIESEDSETSDYSTLHNVEMNQLAFCPQIRIARIFELWCRNAGYKLIEHLGKDINGIFLQSQKSLDGTFSQYDIDYAVIKGTSGEIDLTNYDPTGLGIRLSPSNSESDQYFTDGKLDLPSSGWWQFMVTVECVVKDLLPHWWKNWEEYVNIVIFLTDGEYHYENLLNGTGVIKQWTYLLSDKKIGEKKWECNAKIIIREKLHLSDANLNGLAFSACAYHRNTKEYYKIEKIKLTLETVKVSSDFKQTGFNIFRRKFNIAETLPDVTNASFMKTMLDTMGLCYFVSGKTRCIELVPYSFLSNAKSIDLTDYELVRETETDIQEETKQSFYLKPLKEEGFNENLRLDDISGNHLPDAYANHEHLVMLTKTNTIYRASLQENEDNNWVECWEEHSGNPDKLEIGAGEETTHEPGISIPHQRFVGRGRIHPETDSATGETPQLMVADFTISSDMYNIEDKPSDIILTQYRGLRKREYNSSQGHYVWNEVMLPVWNGEFSLTAKGANSLGEKYVKPVLELANHKTITYKLRLPANMMQPVEDLLRPSDLPPERQTRYIVIRNVKTVPKKITFQIDNNRDDTVLCQIEAVKVY